MKLRPRAEVICFKGNRVLANLRPYVAFPGGGIEANESPIEGAKREAAEECGRVVTTCTVAHPPTVQVWPKGYREEWQKDFTGGYTYWMTGSTSDAPTLEKHEDYEGGFRWYPLSEVINRLKADMHGDWADDVRVRLAVCENHQKLLQPVKIATPYAVATPPLAALRTSLGSAP